MTAPHTQCQPEAAALRRDPPVCCYCDNDLSCGHCGMEQPYDDVSLLKARIEELTKALETARKYCDENLGPSRSSLLSKIAAVIDEALAVPLEDR